MAETFIRKFVSQQCVGESGVLRETYWIGEAIMSDGTQHTVYAVEEWEHNLAARADIQWKTTPPPSWKRTR